MDQSGDYLSGASGAALACDLCVIGAGLTALNALSVAAEYLPAGAKVVLIDRHAGPGGMWTHTYDYVRLHQPHESFTVGNAGWDWDKPRGYLATGAEVRAHLEQCFRALEKTLDLTVLWRHEFELSDESAGRDEPRVGVLCRNSDTGDAVEISAKRLIDARGLAVTRSSPLGFGAGSVVSVAPEDLSESLARDPGAPVYVVGGGKTAMDTVLHVLRVDPTRKVRLIIGEGTIFADRDISLPRGIRRWIGGTPVVRSFADMALRFDGWNETEVFEHFRRTYSIGPAQGEQFYFGFLSRCEWRRVKDGLAEMISGYLDDVRDGPEGPEIHFRDGRTQAVPAGSIFVNCTGYVLRNAQDYAPFLSPLGTTLRITPRSAVLFQPGVAAFFLSHLFFRDELWNVDLYELDLPSLMERGRKVWQMTTVTHAFRNMLVLLGALPMSVVAQCGLDVDRWYPMPRRLLLTIWLMWNRKRFEARCRLTLDQVHDRLGVRCGPLGLRRRQR